MFIDTFISSDELESHPEWEGRGMVLIVKGKPEVSPVPNVGVTVSFGRNVLD